MGRNLGVDKSKGDIIIFIDSDTDGVCDTVDDCPNIYNPYQHDSDGDGFEDEYDAFPFDPNEWMDSDNDGVGDNSDSFPYDLNESSDSDGDGVGDNADAFPENPSQQVDSDGDGYGDYQYGQDGDKFPEDPSQWADSDGDGYGDNQELGATQPDACINQSCLLYTSPSPRDQRGSGMPG